MISNKISFEHTYEQKDKEGRFILVRGAIDGNEITLFNIYAPPSSDFSFFQKIFDIIISGTVGILICGGDLNIHLQPKLDVSNHTHTQKAVAKKFNKLLKDVDLIDIWRDMYPRSRQYTHFSAPHSVYTRIDYFITFGKDRSRIKDADIGSMDLSDHAPIYITLNLENSPRNTTWRFNSSLLNDPSFKKQMSVEIQMYIEDNVTEDVSPPIVWDAAKAVLRGKIIAAASLKKKKRQKKLLDLQNELKLLENKHAQGQNTNILQQIKKLRNEINMIYTQEIETKMLFTRQKYYENGSKFTKLLARKLRKKEADSTIYKIRDPQKNYIENKRDKIQTIFELFYKRLYSKMSEDNGDQIDSFLETLELPVLTEDQNKALNAKITAKELNEAITRLKANKSPGSDGFTTEWYKAFRKELMPILLATCNWALEKAVTPPTWKEAIISLIPKEGKDRTECGSYRPISILNVDYRIYTSVMARRMEEFLPTLIHNDQTGFIHMRQTHDNIKRTLHIMDHIRQHKVKAMILSLDAEKAFDSVSWQYLYKVLNKFGFNELAINAIKAIYDNPTAKLKINGHISHPITLERGVRQGCAWSPLLFAIFLEPLAQYIRQNDKISGITINGVEHKIACYADDVLLYLRQPEMSLPEVMKFLQCLGPLSGYKLNITKTEILTYNLSLSDNFKNTYPLKWKTESFKYLGVILPKDMSRLYEKNYDPLHRKIKEDLARWNLVPFLSLCSRIETIKINVLPRFLYLFQALPVTVTQDKFAEWDKMISRFIWQGKRPRVLFKTLQLPKEKGGWGLPSLKNYYYAAQIRTLLCWCNPSYNAQWKDIETKIIPGIHIQAILPDKNLPRYIDELENPWVKSVLKVWKKVIKEHDLEEDVKILSWCAYDSEFTPNTLDNRFKSWIKKGITSMSGIVEKNEIMCFQTLRETYTLEREDQFRFFQLRNYYNQKIKKIDIKDTNKAFIQIFINAYKSDKNRGIISQLYKCLKALENHSTEYIRERWEKEGGVQITEEEWQDICSSQWKCTKSHAWKEFCWKNVARFFITPHVKSHYDNGNSQCWRNCGCRVANHYHIFWACQNILKYWTDIHRAIQTILNTQIPFDFKTIYLGLLPLELRSIDTYLMSILLAAGKKALTKKWMTASGPNLNDWMDVTFEIYKMEKITFSLNLKMGCFLQCWEKWTQYIGPLRPDFVMIMH